ncbi:hypothetical protein [Paenibacillus nasutitermitis]|uniref:Uncharacterized protein n=1 Tax=Paenibacillus nasutitermitis TaxID=1652958 RepID=A0A917DRL1_9BACL|nr:hypothetical protein [Paenibacillus nasutitermitis]GGD63359.1 hypothetical protein GCM10010911_21400 [Paenibacillus nasutitermitis]
MTNEQEQEQKVHPFYGHTAQAYGLLPAALENLKQLQEAFDDANEDFLAIELKTMSARLEEIRQLLAEGPQG